ncbi:MAG: hypothetical protein NXI23_16420 [Bacteroidetes bacterium]|nr:hypothetical protein [Bacteroidota bacterium]
MVKPRGAICWFVKSGGKGHLKSEDQEVVLKYVVQVLTPLLTDIIPVNLLEYV